MLAYCYPLLALQVRDAIRRREISQAAHDSRSWDADFVRAYDAYEEQQRYHTWKTQHSERRRSQSTATDHGTVGDSRGYYQTLGVHPDATIADIQSAFRGWVQERARGKGTRKMENNEKKYLQNCNIQSAVMQTSNGGLVIIKLRFD